MPYQHTEEWRMRILMTAVEEKISPVGRLSGMDEQFYCFAYWLHGEGLIQVSNRKAGSSDWKVYRFNKHGGLKGIFTILADGTDHLIYDRSSGFGRRHEAEVDCARVVSQLQYALGT